jgi:RND family efflux transporter MFP subunit
LARAGLILPLSLAALPARAEGGTVQVRTIQPERGTAPELLEAFGTAGPALNGGMTLSLQQEGRVIAIDVTPGERVQAGQALIAFASSASASSTYAQAKAALALAQTQRKHAAQLLVQRLATRDQLAQADKSVSDARSTLDALTREGFGTAARTLIAPFDGIVATVPVAIGDRVPPGTALVTMTRLDGLVVTAGIQPSDRNRVRPGEAARLTPLDGGPPIDGRVERIDGLLNPRTRLIDADIAVPAGSVISGAAYTATVATGELSGWKLPHSAVLTDAKGAYVFQVEGAARRMGKAVRVDVKLLGEAGPDDIVSGPITPGRRLVVEGNYQLDNGAALREASNP